MRVFSCPFLSPSLLLSGLFVQGFVSNRNLVESFGRSLLRDSEIHCLWLWVTCLSSFLTGCARFIIPNRLVKRKTLFSLHSPLNPSPLQDVVHPGFGGKH